MLEAKYLGLSTFWMYLNLPECQLHAVCFQGVLARNNLRRLRSNLKHYRTLLYFT